MSWTLLIKVWTPLDGRLLAPRIPPDSGLGTIIRVTAVVFTPGFIGVLAVVAGCYLARIGLRRLAAVVVLSCVLSALSSLGVSLLAGRVRPDSLFSGTSTYVGWSYPSAHVTAAVALAGSGLVALQVLRCRSSRYLPLAIGFVAAIAIDRWLMSAHWVSDLVGGVLLGTFWVALAVAVLPQRAAPDSRQHMVGFYHPGSTPGWVLNRLAPGVDWRPTTTADHGSAMAAAAASDGCARVLVAGGDGTLRNVVTGLAGTGAEVGLIPAGSGNVLAHNVGVPLDLPSALRLAICGTAHPIDLLEVRADAEPPRLCLSMLGVGADAEVLRDTSERTKRLLGPVAYLLAGVRHLRPRLFAVNQKPAAQVVVANVAGLRPGIAFAPGADPADGLLDVIVARPATRGQVIRLIAAVLRGRSAELLETSQAEQVRLIFDPPVLMQVDGDIAGVVHSAEIAVRRAALPLCRPLPNT